MNPAAPPPFRTIRVFISSTFRDMHAERDHLVRFVFPKLREELLPRRIHFVDVDLRWGVTGDQDVLTACREVIDECRPRFVCLLGGRYGWVPPGKARSITAEEVYYGVLDHDLKDRGFAFFYFRDPVATNSIREDFPGEYREPAASPGEKALTELKSSIEAAGFKPFIYTAHWDDNAARLTRLEAFGQRVFGDLLQSVTEEFGDVPPHSFDAFADENALIEAFVDQSLAHFVLGSREAAERQLLAYAKGSVEEACLCLVGEAGSGKSALLAHVARQLSEDSTLKLVSHFVGAGQHSANLVFTFQRLCREFKTVIDSSDLSELRMTFENSIKDASGKGRVVIVLDGINQFGNAAGLSLLPDKLPPNCRIIVSTTPGETLTALCEGTLPLNELSLERLAKSDQTTIIAQFFHRFGKTMTAPQQSALLSKVDANLPLYLRAALEELRTSGTYEEINSIVQDLPASALALFEWIFKRLENDEGFRNSSGAAIGPLVVKNVVTSIAASRRGLSEGELHELLDLVLPNEGNNQGNLSALLLLLRPYLIQRNEQIDFYHDQVNSAAEALYLSDQTRSCSAHQLLALLFLARLRASPGRSRASYEVLYHMRLGQMWEELIACLKSPQDFDRLAPSAYGLDFDASIGGFTGVDNESLTPSLIKTIAQPLRTEIAQALANIFIGRAKEKINLTKAFKQPWLETCRRLRDSDPDGFLRYRDAFYLFIRFAGIAFSYAVVACENSPARASKFLNEDGGSSAFLHYLEHFGNGETGLSHAIEDHAGEARLSALALMRIRDEEGA